MKKDLQKENERLTIKVMALKNQLEQAKDSRSKLCIRYNSLTKRHVEATDELKRLKGIEELEKTTSKALYRAKKKIKDLQQSRKHLKERYGVK